MQGDTGCAVHEPCGVQYSDISVTPEVHRVQVVRPHTLWMVMPWRSTSWSLKVASRFRRFASVRSIAALSRSCPGVSCRAYEPVG